MRERRVVPTCTTASAALRAAHARRLTYVTLDARASLHVLFRLALAHCAICGGKPLHDAEGCDDQRRDEAPSTKKVHERRRTRARNCWRLSRTRLGNIVLGRGTEPTRIVAAELRGALIADGKGRFGHRERARA